MSRQGIEDAYNPGIRAENNEGGVREESEGVSGLDSVNVRSRLRKTYVGALELRWPTNVAQQEITPPGCSKRPSGKAAASEGPNRTRWGTLRV